MHRHYDHGLIAQVARRFFPDADAPIVVERVEEGISTDIFRLRSKGSVYYMRILPEAGHNYTPEAEAHRLLRAHGVQVPEVLGWDDHDPLLERAVMLTTAIPGGPIIPGDDRAMAQEVMRAAGRDLALIKSIPVAGFGWVEREHVTQSITAEWPTQRAWLMSTWDADLAYLEEAALSHTQVTTLRAIVAEHDAWLDTPQACLAHGDFDTTHIFHEHGRYTGIIDFGEIRGTDPYYDLGHFLVHDGERLPQMLFPALLTGYAEFAPHAEPMLPQIRFTRMLIAVRKLALLLPRGYTGALIDLCHAAIRQQTNG